MCFSPAANIDKCSPVWVYVSDAFEETLGIMHLSALRHISWNKLIVLLTQKSDKLICNNPSVDK